MKHNLNCTCQQCGKTGMTVTEQAALCNGTGQRLIGAPDSQYDAAWIRGITRFQLETTAERQKQFGHYPN